jgi:CRISPR-associated endonuclease/helicase Cas3
MSELTGDRYAEFFEALWGYEPFSWQADLTELLLQGEFPSVIDVPTGLGKTSVIDSWVYALAASVDGVPRKTPLRMCFVVDRRLIVDGAFEHAQLIAEALLSADRTGGLMGEVATRLQSLHQDQREPPLSVVRMRGGVTWESRWLARPDQAALVCGTVDQFGSRLLFRGYGASPSMRPIDAALVGTDCWAVVDEAHIASPLTETLGRVTEYQSLGPPREGPAPFRLTQMSATTSSAASSFRPDLDDVMTSNRFPEAATTASKRIEVAKPAVLVDLGFLETASKRSWRQGSIELGKAIAELAKDIEGADLVGVICNTISTARAAHQRLIEEGANAMLLIGRVRGHERDEIARTWFPLIELGSDRAFEGRLFVVATQTIEVGADLDLDAIVTECAALSALVQRFGRVNRGGSNRPRFTSHIVHAAFSHQDDPVYGEATATTWDYLAGRAAPSKIDKPKDSLDLASAQRVDFSVRGTRQLLESAPPGVNPSSPFVPVILGAHIERWAKTNPVPFPDQPVAPFLHGVDHEVPEVEIAWRTPPPGTNEDARAWRDWLDLVPPVEWEFVRVPIWEARALLAAETSGGAVSDLEGSRSLPPDEEFPPADKRTGVVYLGRREPPKPIREPNDIAPGNRLVLRADVGGHDKWGWTGKRASIEAPPVPDVGDLAPTRHRALLRLSQSVFGTHLSSEGVARAFAEMAEVDHPASEVLARLLDLAADPLASFLAEAKSWNGFSTDFLEDHGPVWLLRSPSRRGLTTVVTDDDTASTSQAGSTLTVEQHCSDVARLAWDFAKHLRLPPDAVRSVEMAGYWHDQGKAEPRFQVMLHDGDELSTQLAEEPLAKSGRDPRDPLARRSHSLAALPRGFRHEAVSARALDEMVRIAPEVFEDVDPELVRHLVASHHGKARPLLPAIDDPGNVDFKIEIGGRVVNVQGDRQQIDWSQPARFENLCDKYGWWILALLETIVRLADHRCSEGTT